MNIIYFLWSTCKKKRLQISWNCAGKRPKFLKKFSKVEMFKTKNNTIIVIWFLYIWCAELRWSEVGIILFNLHNLSHRTLPHEKNEIQLLSRLFSYSWLVCLLGFWLRNASLVKADNPISDGIVFVFHLAGCVREL